MSKKIILIFTVLLSFKLNCIAEIIDNNNRINIKDNREKTANVIDIRRKEFLSLIYNYKENKEWKYIGEKPCVIDFYADWCAPCKDVEKSIKILSEEYKGQIFFYRVNVYKSFDLADKFNIKATPTIFFVPLNALPLRIDGKIDIENIKSLLEKIIGN